MFKSVSEFFNGSQGVTPTKEGGGYFLVMDSNLDLLMNMDSLKDKLEENTMDWDADSRCRNNSLWSSVRRKHEGKPYVYIQFIHKFKNIIYVYTNLVQNHTHNQPNNGHQWPNENHFRYYMAKPLSTVWKVNLYENTMSAIKRTSLIHKSYTPHTPKLPLISFPKIWPASNAFVRKVLGNHM